MSIQINDPEWIEYDNAFKIVRQHYRRVIAIFQAGGEPTEKQMRELEAAKRVCDEARMRLDCADGEMPVGTLH